MYCIDASVLTAVFDKNGKFHDQSLSFFRFIVKSDIDTSFSAIKHKDTKVTKITKKSKK